ncbi:MAG TPA: hypothetical protein VMF52_18350 [Steroidobacteraceae bacterium]|nr:hypothetical protein [Steroidobacteraceae bacterium]
MKPTIPAIAAVTLVALAATIGSAYYLRADEKRKPWPKPTPPPPASTIYEESKEAVPTAEEIAAEAATHNRGLALQIERAALGRDAHARETAFTFLLPELLQFEPQLLVDMVKEQPPGEVRDTLRTEVAQQWISRDRDAAIDWMKSLDDGERRAAASAAIHAIASAAPEQALYVANVFDIGHDGYLDNLVRRWAVDEPQRASSWLAAQPDGPRKSAYAETIDRARRQRGGPLD